MKIVELEAPIGHYPSLSLSLYLLDEVGRKVRSMQMLPSRFVLANCRHDTWLRLRGTDFSLNVGSPLGVPEFNW